MLRLSRCVRQPLRRVYSTQKPSTVQLVKKLRELTDAPLLKARQALAETDNDFAAALTWLQRDLISSGAAKASKIKDRTALEGVVSVSVVNDGFGWEAGIRAAIVELNCETDFVAKTDQFARMARDLAYTTAHYARTQNETTPDVIQPDDLMSLQLRSQGLNLQETSVKEALMDLISRTGENVTLRRATSLSTPSSTHRLASYVHSNSSYPTLGRIGALLPLMLDLPHGVKTSQLNSLQELGRGLARQIVGLETLVIEDSNMDKEVVLLSQEPALLGGDYHGSTVKEVIASWQKKSGVRLVIPGFVKWTVGESLDWV